MEYYLLNRDQILISFKTEEQLGITVITEEKRLSKRLPLGYRDISSWIENRNYAKHKEHMKKWLKEWGIDTVDGFLQITHALGLNDTLWIRLKDSDLTWDDVNLYKNEFSDIACKTAFEKGLYGLQLSTTTPEFTTDGSFPKCWLKKDDDIRILKQGLTGAANVGLEPYSEYISSNIGKFIFGNDVISYDLQMFKGRLCSSCKLFTSEDVGYISFGNLVDTKVYYTIPKLLEYFMQYDKIHKTNFEKKFRIMIVLDSIVFNHDRHLNNFGFLFDNESMQILDFAPLFDFNYSFLCSLLNDDLKDYKRSLSLYDLGHKLGGDFSIVGKQIMTTEIREMLPSFVELPKHPSYNMEKDRIMLLADAFYDNYNKIKNK